MKILPAIKILATTAMLTLTAQAAQLSVVEGEESQAPAIDAVDLSGKNWSLDEFAGKVVMINFWATWCPPCLKEIPSMQILWERMGNDDFALIAVNVGDDRETVVDFMESFQTPVDFLVLLDPDLKTVKRWPVFGLPMTFLIDQDGTMVYKALGERDWEDPEIESAIRQLIERQ